MELIRNTIKHRALVFMALPAVIILAMFCYMPMFGTMVAFKNYNYDLGILGSPWAGLDNFKILFVSKDVTLRLIRNTMGYWFLFTIVGTICNLALAVALNECIGKRFAKISHTIMIFPTFISWIAVTFIVKSLLDDKTGIINNLMRSLDMETVSWYTDASKWPVILLITNLWKNVGYGSIIYLSALAGMDKELFEAADLDGATRWQQIRHITIPMLVPMVCIMTLMSMGGIMTSNTGLFYQVTKNIGLLYPTTQTIDAYIMNALANGSTDFGMTSAVTFFQSVVGCIMVLITNSIVRRWEPENALF